MAAARASMQQLTDLTLVEVVASLPMQQVLRLMLIGCPRLRQVCSRLWVLRRMTHVNFATAVTAYRNDGDVRTALCGDVVLKRLYGKVEFVIDDLEDDPNLFLCLEVFNLVPGKLIVVIHSLDNAIRNSLLNGRFFYRSRIRKNILYIIFVQFSLAVRFLVMDVPSDILENMICSYGYDHKWADTFSHDVFYQPSRLNGRGVVDVLRAVCGPSDVHGDQLKNLKLEMTERKKPSPIGSYGGFCMTRAKGPAVIPYTKSTTHSIR